MYMFTVETATAQTVIEADVQENYSGKVAVSGSIIVGVAYGGVIAPVNPKELVIPLPKIESDAEICIAAKTRDGQYWSQANVIIPVGTESAISIKPRVGWKYLNELKLYKRSDFAVLARLGKDCQYDPKALLLPVKYASDVQDVLKVAINSQRAIRVSAQIETGEGDFLQGQCDKASTVGIRSTAFNYLCSFDLTGLKLSGQKTLEINRRLRVGGNRIDGVEIFFP